MRQHAARDAQKMGNRRDLRQELNGPGSAMSAREQTVLTVPLPHEMTDSGF